MDFSQALDIIPVNEFIAKHRIGPSVAERIRRLNGEFLPVGVKVRGFYRKHLSWRRMKRFGWPECAYRSWFR